MRNNMTSPGLWTMLYFSKFLLTTYGHCWLCDGWHLVPNGMAPNCWCRTTYLPNVVRYLHKLWAPFSPAYYESLWAMYSWAPGDVEGFIEDVGQVCWTGPHPIFGTTGSSQSGSALFTSVPSGLCHLHNQT